MRVGLFKFPITEKIPVSGSKIKSRKASCETYLKIKGLGWGGCYFHAKRLQTSCTAVLMWPRKAFLGKWLTFSRTPL